MASSLRDANATGTSAGSPSYIRHKARRADMRSCRGFALVSLIPGKMLKRWGAMNRSYRPRTAHIWLKWPLLQTIGRARHLAH